MDDYKGISGKAKIAGVMGWPVEHTKSPRLHGYWLRKHNIDGAYIPMPVAEGKIEQALRALPTLGFRGCNLTIPHKESSMKIVDEIDPLAKRVGAINTIIVKEGEKLFGTNTDVYGFSQNLKASGFVFDPAMPIATVFGAGGAARAIVVALQDFGFKEIRIVNRSLGRAEALAQSLPGKNEYKIMSLQESKESIIDTGLLVNATSLGMTGHKPLEVNLAGLSKNAWVTDAVYAPLETDLLRQAKQNHIRVVDGLGMLLYQARAGFAAWFDQEPEITEELRHYVLETP